MFFVLTQKIITHVTIFIYRRRIKANRFFLKILLKTLIPCILAFFFPGHLKYIKALVTNSVLSVKPFPFLKLQMSLQLPE